MPTLADPNVDDAVAAELPTAVRGAAPLRWATFVCVAAIAVLAMPMLLGHVYVADDLGEFHLPLRAFYSQQITAGEPWDWMPSLFGGFYLTGEGQLGGYHPLHLLLYRLLPLPVAFDLEVLLSYPALLVGTFLLLRGFVRENTAALFGAACFTFGGFNLLHFVHPNGIAVVAHIPWSLWLIDSLVNEQRINRRAIRLAAGIALLTGSQLLLGYPQYVWFSLLAEGAFAAVHLWTAGSRVKLGSVLCAAKLLGIGIGAAQLLPTAEALGDSTRMAAGSDFTATGSLHPLNIVQFVAPYLFEHRVVGQNTHELGLYFGVVPCVLCTCILLQPASWGRDRRNVIALFVSLLAALLLACGEFAPLYWLQQQLPLVGRFRFPCRGIVLVQLVLAAITAVAFKRTILEHDETSERAPIGPLFLPTMISMALAAVAPWLWPEHIANAWLVWTGPALVGAATALVYFARRGNSLALRALVLFAVADVIVYGASHAILGRTSPHDSYAAGALRPPYDDGTRVVADLSIAQKPLEVGNRMLLKGVQRLDGYAGLEPARRLDYTEGNQLRLAGVGWIYHSQQTEGAWTRLKAPLPRVRLVTRTEKGDHFRNWSAEVFETTALIEAKLQLPPGHSGEAKVTVDRPGKLELVTSAATQQLLVVADSYHQGWQASVDEQVVPVLRVNRDFLGCLVPAGKHHVRLHFSPLSLRLGTAISAGGLGLCVTALALAGMPWPDKRTRRRDKPIPAVG